MPDQALGPKLVTRLLVTIELNKYQTQLLTSGH